MEIIFSRSHSQSLLSGILPASSLNLILYPKFIKTLPRCTVIPAHTTMSQSPSQLPRGLDDENQTEMYIRVKRNKTTYFLQCLPSEKVLQIKEKLQVLIDQPVNNQRLILMGNGEVLEDLKSLADQKVENDAAVALTLRKADNEFEDVNVVKPDDYIRDGDGGSTW